MDDVIDFGFDEDDPGSSFDSELDGENHMSCFLTRRGFFVSSRSFFPKNHVIFAEKYIGRSISVKLNQFEGFEHIW